MDIESLEAANQSLQVDLKLAFKRIGDLQAAIEDDMESEDNDDLINRYPTDSKFLPKTVQLPSLRLICNVCFARACSRHKLREKLPKEFESVNHDSCLFGLRSLPHLPTSIPLSRLLLLCESYYTVFPRYLSHGLI